MDEYPPRPDVFVAAEIKRRQRGRNMAMLLVLLGLAVLFFAITLVKLAHASAPGWRVAACETREICGEFRDGHGHPR